VSVRRPWGWHRLDPYWAEQIVAAAAIRPGELVVDLGAGVGALTLPLLEAGARVIAVELHAGRARRLREKVSDHAASVIECDLEDFLPPGRSFRVVASPPYALTATVLAFVAHARHVTAADWSCNEPSYGACSTEIAETCAGSTPDAACSSPETPSYRPHQSTQPSSN
jgi:23S rRNA (adenine-N6)-dimethyltransferase